MDEFTKARIKDWWPCACVKGGNWRKGKPSTHIKFIKLNAPTRKRCSRCGCTKAQSDKAGARLPQETP